MSLGDLLNRKTEMRLGHLRRCPECNGRGFQGKLAGMSGKYRLMAKVQCGTCKGKGDVMAGEESRENGVTTVRLYGPDGKFLDKYTAG